jgi:hypothetical protein
VVPKPPHDCRITLRCLKATFPEFTLGLDQDFVSLRSENTLIDRFFERRESDPAGGEDGQRVAQIRSKPAFKLTSHRMRGATWFDCEHPPQAIVWLLGAELHDERHKGRSDAYDILGAVDEAGELFPQAIDYERLEWDRRRWDQESFSADVRADAATLVAQLQDRTTATLAGIPTRIAAAESAGLLTVFVAISTRPVPGARSGEPYPLTELRFGLIQTAFCEALEDAISAPEHCEELRDRSLFPGRLRKDERAFGILLERPAGKQA